MGTFHEYIWLILFCGLLIYFLPTIVAMRNSHRASGLVFLVNLIAGWTLLGWIVAIIWAASGPFELLERHISLPNDDNYVKCPDCAEPVLKEARKCKHCGSTLVPQA